MTALAPFRELPARLVEIDVDGLQRLAASEPWLISQWREADEIEKFLLRNRASLDNFPTIEQLDALLSLAKSRATKCTRPTVTREIAKLIGSYPHAQIPDPKTYIGAMTDDVLALGIPDEVVAAACVECRQTLNYPPSIATFLETCRKRAKRYDSVALLVARLREVRAKFERAIEAQHKRLEDLRTGHIEGPPQQLPASLSTGRQLYRCVVPTVKARFENDVEVREALSRMPPKLQFAASETLARIGPGACREFILKNARGAA